MGVTVRIVETYVKEVYVEHTDDFYEAKEYVANNRSKFQIDLNEDFCECNYEQQKNVQCAKNAHCLLIKISLEKAGIATLPFRYFRADFARPSRSRFLGQHTFMRISYFKMLLLNFICFAMECRLTYRHARICFSYAVGMRETSQPLSQLLAHRQVQYLFT